MCTGHDNTSSRHIKLTGQITMKDRQTTLSAKSIIKATGNQTRETIVVDESFDVVLRSCTIEYNVCVESFLPKLAKEGRISKINTDENGTSYTETNPFMNVIGSKQRVDGEYVLTGKNGCIEHISITGTPTVDNANTVSGIFSIELITRERAIREERDRLQTIVEALGDPVYVVDDRPEFVYVNDPFCELTGYTKTELIGSNPKIIKTTESTKRVRQALRQILSDDGPEDKQIEVEITTKSGDRIACEDHIGVLPYETEFNGTAGVLRDISERKEQKQKLQRQNEELEHFISVLTHDLRNPLNIMEGYARQIKTETNADKVAAIERAVSRMRAIIDDTLALHKESESVAESDCETVALKTIAQDTWEHVETGDSTLKISSNIHIECDQCRLRRLFENLYRNGIEHNSEPVEVEVGKYCQIGTATRSTCDGFYIADTGTGIDKQNREEVFDFGETTLRDGTGLGLPIVKRVADAHGWDINLMESSAGGAKFVFTEVNKIDHGG